MVHFTQDRVTATVAPHTAVPIMTTVKHITHGRLPTTLRASFLKRFETSKLQIQIDSCTYRTWSSNDHGGAEKQQWTDANSSFHVPSFILFVVTVILVHFLNILLKSLQRQLELHALRNDDG